MAGEEKYSALLSFGCVPGLHANILAARDGTLGKHSLRRI